VTLCFLWVQRGRHADEKRGREIGVIGNNQNVEGLIDVHAHFTTPSYVAKGKAAGHREVDGMPENHWPRWSADRHLELMHEVGISRSILSISSPGVYFGHSAAARSLAREVNTFAAETARDYPDAFGFFAVLPLPDIDASLDEISFAIDELGAQGVIILSNSGGHYLGADLLDPVLAELDRRNAVVLVHPTTCVGHEALACGRPRPMIEFLFDTARSVVDLVLSGAAERYPNVRLIIPHAGGVLPLLVDRVELFRSAAAEFASRPTVTELLAGCYYDLAGTPSPRQLQALRSVASEDRLLYGSDYPWTPYEVVLQMAEALDHASGAEPGTWRRQTTTNAHSIEL
jgi:predicted TIM-barrel fold metal-dependent hydrolase